MTPRPRKLPARFACMQALAVHRTLTRRRMTEITGLSMQTVRDMMREATVYGWVTVSRVRGDNGEYRAYLYTITEAGQDEVDEVNGTPARYDLYVTVASGRTVKSKDSPYRKRKQTISTVRMIVSCRSSTPEELDAFAEQVAAAPLGELVHHQPTKTTFWTVEIPAPPPADTTRTEEPA